MKCFDDDTSAFMTSSLQHTDIYSSSLESTATTSSISAWSAASSQSSADTSPSTTTSDSDLCGSYPTSRPVPSLCDRAIRFSSPWAKQPTQQAAPAPIPIPTELRQNPRRSSGGAVRCPPSLVRQCDRKVNFVDSLVDSSTQIVEALWPLSSVVCRSDMGSKAVLPLRTFIQETLRRSRTSYSTLQVALYYLILIKPHVPKHDFTMEQPDDRHECRALQCGRRMFLAALILASKYLQDRNYSSRAWSKISGLATQEINQNELAFLLAVNWKMHITDDVFQRWTDIVLKYTPPSPPSPGASSPMYAQQSANWKKVILMLNPGLDNVEALIPTSPVRPGRRDLPSPRSLLAEANNLGRMVADVAPAPNVMEPMPATVHTPGRHVPALGLLPTPRLTPQATGCSTPAANAATYLLGKGSAMGIAMAQASNVSVTQTLDRWPATMASSPQTQAPVRRSSLATSVSTASSPESMVSDTSRTSRSSSISSASSLASAPSHKLGFSARFRCAKLGHEKMNVRPAITSVPEDYAEYCMTSSPDSYTASSDAKLGEMALETPLGRREHELEEMTRDPAGDAARALQALHSYHHASSVSPAASLPRKRSREMLDNSYLQDNVRHLLSQSHHSWPDTLLRPRVGFAPAVSMDRGSPRKRVCCSAEAADGFANAGFPHSAFAGYRGPGMWEGILN